MPKKGKRKNNKERRRNAAVDDDDTDSISSDMTELSVNSEEQAQVPRDEMDDGGAGKFLMAMEVAQEKSADARVHALLGMKSMLQERILTEFLGGHYVTLTDIIERSLKKGKAAEQVSAAKLASVFVISLQESEEAEEVFTTLHPILVSTVMDPSVSLSARKEAASTIALITFLACPEPSHLPDILNMLHNIFCGSLPKGDGKLPTLNPGLLGLHCAALSGVCLLMTQLSATTIYTMAQKMLEELSPVLDTPHTELRIAVGEALAIIHELAKQHNGSFKWRREGAVIERLEKLVNENPKYQAKKDKKVQRSSFREIIHTIQSGEPIDVTVLVGSGRRQQELLIRSWAGRFQYQALCSALEQGCFLHMCSNALVRDVFDLGPPIALDALKSAPSGPKASSKQTAEVKSRLLSRGKSRDNRHQALEYSD